MAGTRISTSLRNLTTSPMSPEEFETLRRRCWIERGLVVIAPEEINDDFVKQGLKNFASIKFGRRMKR